MGKDDYAPLIRQHRASADQARERMFELMNDVEAFDYFASPDSWSEVPVKEKRRLAAQVLESVNVAKSTNGRWQPIDERVTVAWR